MILLLLIPILFCFSAGVIGQTGSEIASYFRRHLSPEASVYLPSDNNYTLETTQRWNAFSAPMYVVSVKPATDSDVQRIVRRSDPSKSQAGLSCEHKQLMYN